MTPEKIAELTAIDQKIADAFVACEASYLALQEAITAKDTLCKTVFIV